MSIFIASTRNIYRSDKYELILQTNMPLERIESLYNNVVYRIIVLKKYKKGGKLDMFETSNKQYSVNRFRSGIYNVCDYIQEECSHQQEKIDHYYRQNKIECEFGNQFDNIQGLAFYVAQIRNIYLPTEYEIILLTDIPLGSIASLDEEIKYRVIVLNKYNKEIEPMDEKQKILNDIEEAQCKLDEARKKLDEYNTGYKRWNLKHREDFYFISSDGEVISECFDGTSDIDCGRYNFYNCFKTREEVQQEADKILVHRQLEDIAKRLNKGKKIDWNNEDQNKYFICYNHWQNTIILEHGWKNKFCGVIYCLDKNFLDIAKREIGEDRLIKYIRGEG